MRELEAGYNAMHNNKKLSDRYNYLPSKIIEIQNHEMRYYVVGRLVRFMGYLAQNPQSFYFSREEIARLLEWGDYWQE